MKPDEKLALLCKIRDAHAYCVVAAARVVLAINDSHSLDDLKQALSRFGDANEAVVNYENSPEYKTWLAGHSTEPLAGPQK